MNYSIEYLNHIASDAWREFKRRIIQRRGYKCERCGADGNNVNLQLHHVTYERLGHEHDADVRLLCGDCHHHADQMRKLRRMQEGW